jgi:methylphosphotriester-DNA--protein-cysteine methyltransferase
MLACLCQKQLWARDLAKNKQKNGSFYLLVKRTILSHTSHYVVSDLHYLYQN